MRQLSATIRAPLLPAVTLLQCSLTCWLNLSLSLPPFPISPLFRFSNAYTLLSLSLSGSDSLIAKIENVFNSTGFLSLICTRSSSCVFFFCSFLQLIQLLRQICWLSLLLACVPLVAGWEVHVLPVRRRSAAGGSAHALHHGGVWLACFFYRHFQVPRVPGFHQHTEDNCGSQVMNTTRTHTHTVWFHP